MNPSSTPTSTTLEAPPPAALPSPGAVRAMNELSWLLRPGNDENAIERAVAFDEHNQRRALLSFSRELLADANNCRTHHLYLRLPAFTLHVWPGEIPEGVVAVELPLHGDTVSLGFGGPAALMEWVDLLSQVLQVPLVSMQPAFYHPFVFALNELDDKGLLNPLASPIATR